MGAFEEIVTCIDNKQSYVVEAGAGSGKTYALIQTLRHIIQKKGGVLQGKKQKIICITYTNVAKNEIIKRIEYNDLVSVFTIHEFLWQIIKPYQEQLIIELCKLNEYRLAIDVGKGKESKYLANLSERAQGIESVFYNDSSFRDFEQGELHHDDVIDLSKMKEEKVNLVDNDETVILPIINKEKSTNKDTTPKVDKKIKLEGMDDNVTINGKKFDPNRIDFTQKVNRKETWEIENVKDKMGGMKHPFHIHGTQFKVLSVDGKKPSEDMRGKKDVISLEPGQKAKIEVVFKNTGTYMFHCHILEHEDNGMMGQIKVTK